MLNLRIPEGDNLLRHVCDHCNTIHYQNPKMIAGCIPIWENEILLCRRAIQPRYGLWTLPAGFIENKETVEEAAVRETFEEAKANIELQGLFALISLPHINQVYIMYRASLLDLEFSAGDESLEVKLFNEGDIPWDQLAFPTIRYTLESYLKDKQRGEYGVHSHFIRHAPQK